MEIAEIYAANGLNQQSLSLIERVKTDSPTEIDSYEDSYVEKIISTYLKLKKYDLALKMVQELENRHKVLALSTVELELDKTNAAAIIKENRNLLYQIGCRAK
jgi:hypothetical protein